MNGMTEIEKMDGSRAHDTHSSPDQFLQSIDRFLHDYGLKDIMKAQLRHDVISILNSSSNVKSRANNYSGEGMHSAYTAKPYDIYDLALHSLVLDHFECMGFHKVISIFLPECGLNEKSMLSWEHALKVFGISADNPMYDFIYTHGSRNDHKKSTLSRIFSSYLCSNNIHRADLTACDRSIVGVQTEDEITNKQKMFKARIELERQFKTIESKYTSSFSHNVHLQIGDDIEQKLQMIRLEYDSKLKQQLAMEVEIFKEEELSRIKIQETLNTKTQIEKIRAELLSDYECRLRREKEAFEKKLRQGAFEQQLIELENHNTRKQLLSDMDHMKRCEAERLKHAEVQRHELHHDLDKARQQMEIAQNLVKATEAKELEMKRLISTEYDRIHVEANKNYLAATEAVRRQSEFYSNELSALSSKYLFTLCMILSAL